MVAVRITDGQQIVFLATHEGQAIRFDEEDVRPMGRQAYGVWGIRMEKGDYLVGMATTPKPVSSNKWKQDAGRRRQAAGRRIATSEVVDVGKKGSLDPFRHRKWIWQAHSR